MKNIQFITFAICLSTLACHACSNEEIKPDHYCPVKVD